MQCQQCAKEFSVLIPDGVLLVEAAPRYCPHCGHALDSAPWEWSTFSAADLWVLCESAGANPQALFDGFVAARGAQAADACGHAVMEALNTEFWAWLAEDDGDDSQ